MTTITAQSETDICNAALGNIGITTQIQSLSDQSQQAQSCAFWYPKARDYVLRHSPWNFAQAVIALASDPSVAPGQLTAPPFGTQFPFPGWPFAYVYPNDCLQAIAVTSKAGLRFGPQYWSNWWWPTPALSAQIPKVPTKIVQSIANPGQLMILCDLQSNPGYPVYLQYIQCVSNTAQFDVMFIDALEWYLGWKLGMSLRSADKAKAQYCQASWEKARAEALAQVLNESQQDLERQSPSVLARL
jgi:hypothetical protein